jgi:DNA repair photolyase
LLDFKESEMKISEIKRKSSITRSTEFEKKKLATHALNVGVLCGHGCLYCSTPAMMRTQQKIFKKIKGSSFRAFQAGIAVVDPDTPRRISLKSHRLKPSDTVMFCTYTDGWSPEAQKFQLGRNCLRAVLTTSRCKVRILTKNAAVQNDFDLLEQYADRVELSLSLTAPLSKSGVMNILEPQASPIGARIEVLKTAKRMGIRIYGILCPCLPGIASEPDEFGELLDVILSLGPTAIWTEPVNPRGPGLRNCKQRLRSQGFIREADALNAIRNRNAFKKYVYTFIETATAAASKRGCSDIFNILVYDDGNRFNGDDRSVIWLKK